MNSEVSLPIDPAEQAPDFRVSNNQSQERTAPNEQVKNETVQSERESAQEKIPADPELIRLEERLALLKQSDQTIEHLINSLPDLDQPPPPAFVEPLDSWIAVEGEQGQAAATAALARRMKKIDDLELGLLTIGARYHRQANSAEELSRAEDLLSYPKQVAELTSELAALEEEIALLKNGQRLFESDTFKRFQVADQTEFEATIQAQQARVEKARAQADKEARQYLDLGKLTNSAAERAAIIELRAAELALAEMERAKIRLTTLAKPNADVRAAETVVKGSRAAIFDAKDRFVRTVTDITREYYDSPLQQLKIIDAESGYKNRLDQLKPLPATDHIKEEANRTLWQTYIQPQLMALAEKYFGKGDPPLDIPFHSYRALRKTLSDPPEFASIQSVYQEFLQKDLEPLYGYNQKPQTRGQELQQLFMSWPVSVQTIFHQLGVNVGFSGPPNHRYEDQVLHFVEKIPAYLPINAWRTSSLDNLERLRAYHQSRRANPRESQTVIGSIERTIKEFTESIDNQIANPRELDHFDTVRWQALKANPAFHQQISDKQIDQVDHYLAQVLLRTMFSAETYRGKELTQKLENYQLPGMAPYVFLGYFREIQREPAYAKDTDTNAHLYAAKLTAAEGSSQVDGSSRFAALLERLKANPASLTGRSINTPEWDRFLTAYRQATGLDYFTNHVRLPEDLAEAAQKANVPVELPTAFDQQKMIDPAFIETQMVLRDMILEEAKKGGRLEQTFLVPILTKLNIDDLGAEAYTLLDTYLTNQLDSRAPLSDELLSACFQRLSSLSSTPDRNMVSLLAKHYPRLANDQKYLIHQGARMMFGNLLREPVRDDELLTNLAPILGVAITPAEILNLARILQALEKHGVYHYDTDSFTNLPGLVQSDPRHLDWIRQLGAFGYQLTNRQIPNLTQLSFEQEQAIIQDLETIKKLLPKNQFAPVWEAQPVTPYGTEKGAYNFDPYASLYVSYASWGSSHFIDHVKLLAPQTEDPAFAALAGGLARHFGITDSAKIETFQTAYQQYIEAFLPGGELEKYPQIFGQTFLVKAIAKRPELRAQLIQLPSVNPELMKMLADGGQLASNRLNILKQIIEADDLFGRADQISQAFNSLTPYWRQLFLFTDIRLRSYLEVSQSTFPVKAIDGVSIEGIVTRHLETTTESPTARPTTRLERLIKPDQRTSVIAALSKAEPTDEPATIPFAALTIDTKRLVFRDAIRQTVERSRSPEYKHRQDAQNRAGVQAEWQFREEVAVHGTHAKYIDSVFLNGNLPGEALGEGSSTDAFPFHVDFFHLNPAAGRGENIHTIEEFEQQTTVGGYGGGNDGDGMYLIYDRTNPEAYAKGQEIYAGIQGDYHDVIIGGLPSTEIEAIVVTLPYFKLTETLTTLEKIKQSVVENGFYIPLYDRAGKLLFTPAAYDSLRATLKPYATAEDFLEADTPLAGLDQAQASGLHRFTLKEHLERVTTHAGELAEKYNLPPRAVELVRLAGRLHDIGKGTATLNTNQAFDNPVAAEGYLRQIEDLSVAERQIVLFLIQHDELLGNICQGKERPEAFTELLKNGVHQRMLLALFRGDVWEIDGTGEQYRAWQVDEKLVSFGLERPPLEEATPTSPDREQAEAFLI